MNEPMSLFDDVSEEQEEQFEAPERRLPMVVLGEMVIMPHMTIPLQVPQGKSYRAMERAWDEDRDVLLIFVREHQLEGYKSNQPQNLPPIGVIAQLQEFAKLNDGTARVILEGQSRAQIIEAVQITPFYRVRCRPVTDPVVTGLEVEALMETVKQQVDEFVEHLGEVPQEAVQFVHRIDRPGHLADIVTWGPAFDFKDRLEILNTLDPVERLRKAYLVLARQLELLKLRVKIQQDTKEVLDQSQREYFLREQLRVIRRELGEDEEGDDPIDELRRKIHELNAPEYVKNQALHELKRLAQQGMNNPESGVIRTYLDWILSLPWADEELPEISITEAQKVLDADHYGLEKVKERILEYLAVRKLAGDKLRSPILCFVGPPGVGKTSLGRSIARALGRKFVRTSLGGVRDEAEIRGHRRTYIGALPGRILQGLKQAGVKNPVFMMDEIDKLGIDFRGDPSAALLEALDPEQNVAFSDHYLNLPFDLSQVLFLLTANIPDTIPAALLDRMEILTLSGYTEEEKMAIARRHLLPRQVRECGLKGRQLEITDEALRRMVRLYTSEAGLRNLEREIAALCRKVARRVAEGKKEPVVVTRRNLQRFLGPPKFIPEMDPEESQVGLATGLAWTSAGGEVLYIEATLMKGKGELIVTGQIGDVMQESARAAVTFARSTLNGALERRLKLDVQDIHIHVPAGAIPKDGPSAGIAMATALVSVLTGRPVRGDVAMTGEVTLRGRVLPVGGLKEKILGALRAGIKTVLIPRKNVKDLEEIPATIRRRINLVPVQTMEEVLRQALVDPGRAGRPARPLGGRAGGR